MSAALATLFKHHLWANERLVDAVARLTEGQLDAAAPGVYGTIRKTLVHLAAAETRYVAAMQHQPGPTEPHEDAAFPGLDVLRACLRRSGEALLAFAEAGAESRMRGESRGERYDLPLIVPLAQALNHATEHRTNITTTIASLGIAAPKLDLWQYQRERAASR
jgi:uncharacterized damage-inducible protein DinB